MKAASASAISSNSDGKILISVECHIKGLNKCDQKQTDPTFGACVKAWSQDQCLSGAFELILFFQSILLIETVLEVLDDTLASVNHQWEQNESLSLLWSVFLFPLSAGSGLYFYHREEVELWLKGNMMFHPGTQNDTIGNAYDHYMKGELASYYT